MKMDASDLQKTKMSCNMEDTYRVSCKEKRFPVMLASFSAFMYIVVFGMVTCYSAPAYIDMLLPGSRFRDVNAEEITWIASLPALTGVIGNALSGYASHKFGRKSTLMYVAVPLTISWLLVAYARHITMVYIGRLMSGLCTGFCTVAVPAYVVEISTVKDRGFYSAGFQVAFALGAVLVMTLGAVLRWSWLAIVGAVVVAIGACLLLLMPESPHWLARMGMYTEAIVSLKFLRGKHYDSIKELEDIREHLKEDPKENITWQEFLNPGFYKPVLIAISIMFFQQFSGINSLMSYSVELFQEAKISLNPSVASIILAFVQLFVTFFSSILMDKAGRKVLYIISGSCMTMSLVAMGIYSYCSRDYATAERIHLSLIPLISFSIYIASFSLGFGPIPFVIIPEMIPTRLRSLLLAVANVSASFFGFVIIKVFDNMRNQIGLYGVYWTYAFFSFLGFLFYWVFIPETKGKTIKEIHRSLSKVLSES